MVNTARTVVYRHPCDCESASRPLGPGETAEHRFEVDGEPFPWHITGPVFISAGDRDVPLIALTFLAEHVDTDTEVVEA